MDDTLEKQLILAEIDGIYDKWRTTNSHVGNKDTFKLGYLIGLCKGLGKSLNIEKLVEKK
jgi:hypothetical protein